MPLVYTRCRSGFGRVLRGQGSLRRWLSMECSQYSQYNGCVIQPNAWYPRKSNEIPRKSSLRGIRVDFVESAVEKWQNGASVVPLDGHDTTNYHSNVYNRPSSTNSNNQKSDISGRIRVLSTSATSSIANEPLIIYENSEKSNSKQDPKEPNRKDQNRKANLGAMIDDVKALVPNILNKSLPKSIISSDISLRICPSYFDEYNAYLPNLKGHVTYYATCKALQLFMTSVVLSPKVQLHIHSLRVSHSPDPLAVFPDTTKIHVRWSTCSEGCYHLSLGESPDKDSTHHSTSEAKLGSHRWSKLDAMEVLRNGKESEAESSGGVSKTLPSITTALTRLPAALIGLTKENKKLERVLSGVFVFELNENNDKIIVHTIENVDVIERFETEDIDGELRVC
ncbi:uncharacterized protein RJT20DRAFT_126294 [Scheffersomyces xylosifermentans]|uniref:uncharacterized protein n=1 Tax=Scheffersomyces xylosifermentans TaxID=1304137 RepID=UPI00315DAFBA